MSSPVPSRSVNGAASSATRGRSPGLRLEVPSDPAALAGVRRSIEAYATQAGFDAKAVADVGLCVNEAMANIIRHAYRGAVSRPILITADLLPAAAAAAAGTRTDRADCGPARLTVTIRDWGNGFNPSSLPARDRDPCTPGGLGLICLRQLMDTAVFTPQPDGMLLTMTKNKASKC
jgi:serine/threonine-protein kinase RsbW